jgi:hypothetical protein
MSSRRDPTIPPSPRIGRGGQGGEGESRLTLHKRRTRLPDGRELIYFEFERGQPSRPVRPASVDSVSTL